MTREEFQIVARQAIEFGRSTGALKLSYDQLMAHDAQQRQVIDGLEKDREMWKAAAQLNNGTYEKQAKTIEDQRRVIEERVKEVNRLQSLVDAYKNLQVEEMGYTLRECAALGIDFDKEVISEGKALTDCIMTRIKELTNKEKTIQRLREALDWSGLKITIPEIHNALVTLGPIGLKEEAYVMAVCRHAIYMMDKAQRVLEETA